MLINNKAPGCYGFPSVYQPKTEPCLSCVWQEQCQRDARDLLEQVEKDIDCSAIHWKFDTGITTKSRTGRKLKQKKQKSVALNESQTKLITTLPVAVQPIVSTLFKRGVDINKDIQAKRNPFAAARPRFLYLPIELLLAQNSFHKNHLLRLYREAHPEWSEITAQGYVTRAIQILQGLSVVQVNDKEVIYVGDQNALFRGREHPEPRAHSRAGAAERL